MTDRLAVTLTTDELRDLLGDVVRAALVAQVPGAAAADEMTIEDVLRFFSIKRKDTIYRWRRDLGFPAPHRRGNRVRYLRSEVDVWRAQQGTSGAGAVTVTPPGRNRRTGVVTTGANAASK